MKVKLSLLVMVLVFIVGCGNSEEISTTPQENKNEAEEIALEREGSLLSENRFLNIAHRGASGHAPEHTLVSYQMGEDMNADYIEIDLQMTKDGILVAMHDSDISRTTDVEGAVNDFLFEEIKILDAGAWFNIENPDLAQPVFSNVKVPPLDEILETFGHHANYYIETKSPETYPGMVEALLEVLHQHELVGRDIPEGQVIIQSFDSSSLLEVKAHEPSIPLIKLLNYGEDEAELTEQEITEIKEYAVGIGVNYKSLTKEFVEKVLREGLLIHPYTVNEKEDMERLIHWGVTGIFTDYPDRLEEVLETYTSQVKEE
ncbi:glycerophosphodiester phosphodiesterase [Virgibacillus oceani]